MNRDHSTKKLITTMLTYPWKCTVLHCNHLGNTWKPLVLMTRQFDYCPSASEHGDNQSVRSSAPVVSTCFPGGYNVKLYIFRGRLAWWLLAFLPSVCYSPLPHNSYTCIEILTYATTHSRDTFTQMSPVWCNTLRTMTTTVHSVRLISITKHIYKDYL